LKEKIKKVPNKTYTQCGLKAKPKVGASIPPKLRFDVLGEIN